MTKHLKSLERGGLISRTREAQWIVLIQSFSDKDGALAPHPMAPEQPLEMLATTTFEDIGPGTTRITMSWRPYNSDEAGTRAFDARRQA
jgi:hypothetical protein